jgi:Zn-dependent alcohol dehydrogenase
LFSTEAKASVRDDIELRDLRAGEVRVRIEAAGLCHSDVSVIDGTIQFPPPVVLGHEGAGVVVGVAPDVTNLAEGDHVVLSTLGNCGIMRGMRPGQADVLPGQRRSTRSTVYGRRSRRPSNSPTRRPSSRRRW